MNAYFKLGIVVVLLLIGAAIGNAVTLYGYAKPEIASLNHKIELMQAASQQDKLNFVAAAAAKQKEYDDAQLAKDNALAAAQAASAANLSRVIAAGNGLSVTLDSYVRADQARRLSDPTGAVCRADDSAQTLGQLLEGSQRLAEHLAGEAEGLADQLRAFQAVAPPKKE